VRFDRISLRNFKPYPDADLALEDGVTVVHGLNGSGKSSLLEACFFALYGARAIDGTLEDVVTNGAEECEVTLAFTHDGGEYSVERRVRATGDTVRTADCVLEGPDGTVEGATDVRGRVTELLRMDHEAFLNCAYVRQGEVNKLINASPGQRQDMIDDLLQLGRLEEYRERAGAARLGVEDVLGEKRGALESLDEQIADVEEQSLPERLNDLQSDLAGVEEEIENYEAQREKARTTRDEAERVLESHQEKRRELEEVEDDVEELRTAVREAEAEREEYAERVRELRERAREREGEVEELADALDLSDADRAAVGERLEELDRREERLREEREERLNEATAYENQADALRETGDDLADRAAETREAVADRESALADARAELESRRERRAEIDAERERLRERFADAPVEVGAAEDRRERLREELSEVRSELSEVRAELETVRSRIEEAEELLAAGNCPECGQPVEGSPHVESLERHRERASDLAVRVESLADRREELEAAVERAEELVSVESRLSELASNRELLEERIADAEADVSETEAEIESLREEAEALEDDAAERREVAAEKAAAAEAARRAAAELADELDALADRRGELEAVEGTLDAISDAEDEIDRLADRRESLAALNDERRERLAEKRARREELRDAVDEERVGEARERKARAEDYLDRVTDELDRLNDRRDELLGAVESVRTELSTLEDLRERRADLAERVAALESVREEVSDLESMYGDLRAELRQRNVETLERMLNETFDLVYGNDAYSHIRLDGEYELTVFQKDGDALDPEQLSGGERALFNLSLRCAIYRLLAEGIEGAAPLPPLIFDEPTVFLDAGHVGRLVDLVDRMRELGVRQILIVSHDDELVGAADDLVTVEKDPTTNRSTVRRETAAATVAGDD
jgi:exonuclease SbcC